MFDGLFQLSLNACRCMCILDVFGFDGSASVEKYEIVYVNMLYALIRYLDSVSTDGWKLLMFYAFSG